MTETRDQQKAPANDNVAALVDNGSLDFVGSALNKRLLLKTDLLVLPLIVLTSTFAFLDKNGMAYAAVYGMKTDTNLKGQEYSWLGSIFYFGYLLAEFPTLWLLPKVPIGKYIGVCLTCWGLCLCCMAACHNFGGLAAVRFLLGVFEAGILPALMMMNSMWWRREEQPLRTALWYNTFAGIFGGILSYAIGKINGSLETWKYIFLIYGSVTMGYGILVFAALPDRPEKAWFFSAEEKKASIIRTADNQTEAKKHREWKTAHILEAVRDPKYWCVVVFTIAQSITNAGITNFNPLIISGYGFSQSKTTLMATPQAAVALVAQVFCTTLAFFIPNIRCVLWVLGTLPALAGAVMIHVLDVQAARSASLAGVYLMGFYNVAWVLMLSLQSSNTAGETKKSFCSVSVAVFYAVGNIVGPQFFRESQTTGVLYGLLCVVENRRRDSLYGRPVTALEDPSLSTEAEDRTDFENTNFRYVY
ncbi:Major facilitator superfamily [Neofusicoccum parvum]|uniref:Major facilitator superfamily n=1 Tax=Neofusicoccum parvum TaxID=310453 RepID=A0ACB5RYP7_9PEZI|nr:Major facilitator superfamily [Neofusicoccum parvum]GME32541.1 Major facilitator superfamily [Neofusicoccum parvum]